MDIKLSRATLGSNLQQMKDGFREARAPQAAAPEAAQQPVPEASPPQAPDSASGPQPEQPATTPHPPVPAADSPRGTAPASDATSTVPGPGPHATGFDASREPGPGARARAQVDVDSIKGFGDNLLARLRARNTTPENSPAVAPPDVPRAADELPSAGADPAAPVTDSAPKTRSAPLTDDGLGALLRATRGERVGWSSPPVERATAAAAETLTTSAETAGRAVDESAKAAGGFAAFVQLLKTAK